MRVFIVGMGKLAHELRAKLCLSAPLHLAEWPDRASSEGRSIVIHAGSGRELVDVKDHCCRTHSTLIELSTDSEGSFPALSHPVVLCPNANILMLKFMAMMERCGHLFKGHEINLTESHQSSKASVPGTAVNMAASLGLPLAAIRSVRDPEIQRGALGISSDALSRHAFHEVVIQSGGCSLNFTSLVVGDSPYAHGVARIVEAVRLHPLEDRVHSIMEFVDAGWL